MGLIQSFIESRMAAIENALTVNGSIVSNNLILTKKDGTTVNVGNVKGPTGDAGGAAQFYSATTTESFYLPRSVWTNTWDWAFTEGSQTLFTLVHGLDGSSNNVDYFTATQTGLYLANFSYTFYDAEFCRHFVGFFINDTTQSPAWQNHGIKASNSSYMTLQVCAVLDLVAGQSVYCKLYQDGPFDLSPTIVSPYAKVNFLKVG